MAYEDAMIINQESIMPGEHKTIMLPMPKLNDWTGLSMPVYVFRGKQQGPTLTITGAIHGDEVNGIEVVRRLLKSKFLKNISGTLIAVPVVNVFGFLYQSRYLMDRRDLNRCFPGLEKGSLAARLAFMLTNEIINKTTHMIDLHSGSLNRSNFPQIRCDADNPEVFKIAHAFNVPVILRAALREGSLRKYAYENNIPFLLYEAGESMRFDETAIATGLNGILNVMQELEMITGKKKIFKDMNPTISRNSYWLRAPHSGIFHPFKSLGKSVKKGELLANIGNPMSTEEHKLISPISGVIIGKNNLPVVHEGAALYHVASFEENKEVADQIEYLQSFYDGGSEDL